ncbi:MAG: GNAT family N-acetyltransferase [Acetobacteraceae bacterium]|nr:GNAT family N-acetyltransferase [Pseudomonadota bacterium]
MTSPSGQTPDRKALPSSADGFARPVAKAFLRAPVTPAGQADCAILASIHAAAFAPGENWSSDIFSLQLALPNVLALTDSADGLILVRTAADEAEVLTLAVRPTERRRRLGSVLLEAAILHVATAGVRVVFLEVSTKNTAALALYRGFGFTNAGIRRRYYSDGTDAYVMRLDLPVAPPATATIS